MTPVSDKWQNVESIGAADGKVIFSARRFDKAAPYLFFGDVEVYDVKTGNLDVLMDENTFRVYGVGFVKGAPVFAGTKGLLHGFQNENSSFYGFDADGKAVSYTHLFGHYGRRHHYSVRGVSDIPRSWHSAKYRNLGKYDCKRQRLYFHGRVAYHGTGHSAAPGLHLH